MLVSCKEFIATEWVAVSFLTYYVQDRFYIFDLARLRQLQTEALDKHGNNTRAVVDDIVGHLKQEMPDYAISSTEEWVSESLKDLRLCF